MTSSVFLAPGDSQCLGTGSQPQSESAMGQRSRPASRTINVYKVPADEVKRASSRRSIEIGKGFLGYKLAFFFFSFFKLIN